MRSWHSWRWHSCPSRYTVASECVLTDNRNTVLTLISWTRCSRFAFVDKSDYDHLDKMACPFPGCHHTWCKNCQQEISSNGPKHTCDGSSELKYLVKQMGWKHCPGTWGVYWITTV